MKLEKALSMLQAGKYDILNDVKACTELSNMAVNLINCPVWTDGMIHLADLILRISNIAYNNTSNTVLPLDDGVYDQLLVLYSKYNPNYQVGATPIMFEEQPQNEITTEKVMCVAVNDMYNKL